MGPNFLQSLRANHFRYRHAVFSNQRKKEQRKKNIRDRFLGGIGKSRKLSVSQNCSMDFDENHAVWSLFNTFSAQNIKSAEIKILKNRFCENFAYLHM